MGRAQEDGPVGGLEACVQTRADRGQQSNNPRNQFAGNPMHLESVFRAPEYLGMTDQHAQV